MTSSVSNITTQKPAKGVEINVGGRPVWILSPGLPTSWDTAKMSKTTCVVPYWFIKFVRKPDMVKMGPAMFKKEGFEVRGFMNSMTLVKFEQIIALDETPEQPAKKART